MLQEKYTPEELKGLLRQAHFHLGQVLYLGELDFDRAVSELEEALRSDPQDPAALFHLGRALRLQVERNKMRRAREVWRAYLLAGAPLGHEDEVRAFLGMQSRTGTGAGGPPKARWGAATAPAET